MIILYINIETKMFTSEGITKFENNMDTYSVIQNAMILDITSSILMFFHGHPVACLQFIPTLFLTAFPVCPFPICAISLKLCLGVLSPRHRVSILLNRELIGNILI